MIQIERHRGHPVYIQIREQLERRIASGALAPGEALPSVRAMAQSLRVNPNTVVRAYRELEGAGLVETRHGEGTFVSEDAGGDASAEALLRARASEFAAAAKELGASREAALSAIRKAWVGHKTASTGARRRKA